MDDKQELPRYSGPVDHLRYGFRSLETEFSASHPVETIQNNFSELNWVRNIETVRRIHGSGFAMTIATDRSNLMKKHKLPGLESSSILLDTVIGNDLTVDFEDFLNDPLTRPDVPKLTLHHQMEINYLFKILITAVVFLVRDPWEHRKLMVDHQKRRASKASEPIAIRIFENQRRYYYGGDFEPHKKTPWTLVLTNETCNSFEDFELPGSGEWCWISNWKIDMTTVETDIFGWEYASKLRRFQVQNRTHKPEPYSADLARRRRWVRFMSRSDCVAATLARMRSVSTSGQPHIDFEVLIPRIQNSLARVHSTRIQVEGLMISSDTSNSGPPSSASSNYTNEMQSFLLPLQVHIQEVLAAFESLEKQQEPPPTVAGVLKKLRNDVIKEQAALLKLLKPHQSKEEATPTLESQANGLRRLDNLSNRGSFSSNPFASNASSNSSGNMSNHYLRASLSEAYRNSQSTTRPSMNRPSDIENTLLYQSTSTFTKKQANNDDQEMKSSDGTIITTNLKSIQESEELSENGRSNGKNRLSFNSKKNEGTVTATFSPAPPVVNEYQSSAIVNKEGQDRTTLSSYSSGWGTNPVATRTSTNKNTNIGASSSSSSAAVGVRSGNANTFNPSLLLATVPSTGKSDGMFVQRTAEEQRIDTKLQRVDSMEVEEGIIDERVEDILQIQKGLVLVNEMFSDMSRLILDQQEHVDTIYTESEITQTSAQQALNHLMRANQTQKRSSCVIS